MYVNYGQYSEPKKRAVLLSFARTTHLYLNLIKYKPLSEKVPLLPRHPLLIYIRVHQILEIMLDLPFQKVHTFQKSLDAVLQRLGESEMGQNTLSNTACTLQPGQTAASLENEILLFRNQLKIQSANLVSDIWP